MRIALDADFSPAAEDRPEEEYVWRGYGKRWDIHHLKCNNHSLDAMYTATTARLSRHAHPLARHTISPCGSWLRVTCFPPGSPRAPVRICRTSSAQKAMRARVIVVFRKIATISADAPCRIGPPGETREVCVD